MNNLKIVDHPSSIIDLIFVCNNSVLFNLFYHLISNIIYKVN